MESMVTRQYHQWIFSLFLFVCSSFYVEGSQPAILQGVIHIQSAQSRPTQESDRIQPGTSLKPSVIVENSGEEESPAGEIFIRYALAAPLDEQRGSIIYESEKKILPQILPGKSVEIVFDTPHITPAVMDFVKYDWALREYQAIAIIHKKEKVIGTLALTFSAYYYGGIKKEFPSRVE
jgi:hypothetical protein